jgi:hypothetical protein
MAQQQTHSLNLAHLTATGGMATPSRFTAQKISSPQLGRTSRAARNGTLATATPLGTFPPGNRKFKNNLSRNNPVDFFQIELTGKGRIKLTVSNRSEAPITASILDAMGKVVSLNGRNQRVRADAGTKAETLIKSAEPGVYYLSFRGNSNRTAAYEANLFVNRPGGPQPLPCGCGE